MCFVCGHTSVQMRVQKYVYLCLHVFQFFYASVWMSVWRREEQIHTYVPKYLCSTWSELLVDQYGAMASPHEPSRPLNTPPLSQKPPPPRTQCIGPVTRDPAHQDCQHAPGCGGGGRGYGATGPHLEGRPAALWWVSTRVFLCVWLWWN